MIYPRWLAQIWAYFLGYFWIPCPVCREPFAGFEASSSPMANHRVENGEHVSEVTCSKPACIAEAGRQQMEFFRRVRAERAGRIVHIRPTSH